MRHTILGPGGIGGLIGAVLASAGESVTLVVRPGTAARYPGRLHLESPLGARDAAVTVAERVPDDPGTLWITVKATQLAAALESVPQGARAGAVVPLLNGIDHLVVLRTRFGREPVVPATIACEAESSAPGRIVHRSPFVRLRFWSGGRERLAAAAAHLTTFGADCQFVEDEATLMWSKLVFLAPVALATTAAALPIGEVLADPARREQFERTQREACAVAVAEGARVDAEQIVAAGRAVPPALRSSMQKDVEKGRPPELDAIAGPILRGGERHGIELPAVRALVRAVRERAGA